MNKQEMIKFLRDKFKKQDEDIANLRKSISSLTFTTLVLNELIKKNVSEEETKAAIELVGKQMGKLKALLDANLTNPNKLWEKHFKWKE